MTNASVVMMGSEGLDRQRISLAIILFLFIESYL